jgi:hypothetical protein
MKTNGSPLAAANLCGHYRLPGSLYARVIDLLERTSGSVVNDYLSQPEKAGVER